MVGGLVTINHSVGYNGVAFLTSFWLHLADFRKLGKLASTLDKQRRKKLLSAVCPINISFGSSLTEKMEFPLQGLD